MIKIQKNKRARRHGGKRLPLGPNGGVQLLLIQTVSPLGKQGDVVEVKPGYANNYLIPQGLATVATEHHRRMIEKHRELLREIQAQRLAGMKRLAERLAGLTITIEARANEEGNLYGSIGADEIVKALAAKDIHITNDNVRLDGPLKVLGMYSVKIKLGEDLQEMIQVWVVPITGSAEA